MASDISVLILARNEEANIRECIESCTFAGEVIVIDDFSTDDTEKIAEACGARVIRRAMDGDWGGQQTFAVEQARCGWIFFIDADERCTPEAAEEIARTVEKGEKAAYWLRRQNRFRYNKAVHGVLRPDYVCRLMPAEGVRVEGYVHPAILHPYADKKLQHFLLHYTYDNWDQ